MKSSFKFGLAVTTAIVGSVFIAGPLAVAADATTAPRPNLIYVMPDSKRCGTATAACNVPGALDVGGVATTNGGVKTNTMSPISGSSVTATVTRSLDADRATRADSAALADQATRAQQSDYATEALRAARAAQADLATRANSADTATAAARAALADRALTADTASGGNGTSAFLAPVSLVCPDGFIRISGIMGGSGFNGSENWCLAATR